MKSLGLDIGDVWTGIAISDALGMFAHPLTTVKTDDLSSFLEKTLKKENVRYVVVGYPKTLRGTESDQTKKTSSLVQKLEKDFSFVDWVLWDERLTSKYARKQQQGKRRKKKEEVHAVAAAFILTLFLDYKAQQKSLFEV
jgi:putative Holliday junction resolvase